MNIKKITLLIVSFITFSNTYANFESKVDSNKSYKVNVFSTDHVLPQFQNKASELPKFALKIDPLTLISGDMPLFLEYKLKEQISLELGFGFTTSQFNLLNIDMLENAPSDVQAPLGYSIRVNPRYYLPNYDEAINGYYVSPQFLYRKYHSLYDTGNGVLTPDLKLQENQTDFKLVFGFQNIEDYAFLLDYYIGVGIRKTTKDVVENDGSNNLTVKSLELMKPSFTVGIKIGLAL